jgi:hypothetical protein
MRWIAPYMLAAAALCAPGLPADAQTGVPPLLAPPVDAPIARRFDPPEHPWGPGHRGIDYRVPAWTPVRAAAEGRVTFAGRVGSVTAITIGHGGGLETTYSSLLDVHVSAGQMVGQGRWIGTAAAVHPGGAPGLHFGVKLDDGYVDPESFLGPVDVAAAINLAPVRDEPEAPAQAGPDRCRAPAAVNDHPVAPNDNVAVVIAALNSATVDQHPVLFSVPGLLGYPDERVYFFSYRGRAGPRLHEPYEQSDTRGDLRVAARRLDGLLRALARRHPGTPVDLIAQSQGGIVARELLSEIVAPWDPSLPPVEHLVTFASPHRGAPLAAAAGVMRRETLTGGPLLEAVGSVTGGDGWLPDPASTAVWQLDPTSPLMTRLAREDVLFGTRVLSLGIEEDLVVPADHALFAGKTGRVVTHDGWPLSAHRAVPTAPGALRLAHAFLRDAGLGCPTRAEAAAVARARIVSFAERALGPLYAAAEGAVTDAVPGLGPIVRVVTGGP